jgi:alpha-tubulin suppressor-like RCC1 family protein
LVPLFIVACVGDDPLPPTPGTTTDAGTPETAPPTDAPAVTCDAPKKMCGSDCVDVMTSSLHCGECGKPCTDTTCSSGICGGAAIKQISTGAGLSCVVQVSGEVKCWGLGVHAGLGERFEAGGVACGSGRCRAIPAKVPNLEPVESISVAHQAACAVTKNQDVYCWGRNRSGEVGTPGTATCDQQPCIDKPTMIAGLPKISEVSVGLQHACARSTTGEVWCWGAGAYGGLGRGNFTDSSVPAKVKSLPVPATSIAVSGDQFGATCALVENRAWCWGYNQHLQLGHANDSDPACKGAPSDKCNPTPAAATNLGALGGLKTVVPGSGHTCVLTAGNAVHCWGYPGYKVGSLGTSSTLTTREVTTNVRVLSGRAARACVGYMDGTLGCWGESSSGTLGYVAEANAPQCITGTPWTCNNGSPSPIALPGAVQLDTFANSLVVDRAGKLWTWGPNGNAELARDLASGPKQCPVYGGGTNPCSNVPGEVTIP